MSARKLVWTRPIHNAVDDSYTYKADSRVHPGRTYEIGNVPGTEGRRRVLFTEVDKEDVVEPIEGESVAILKFTANELEAAK